MLITFLVSFFDRDDLSGAVLKTTLMTKTSSLWKVIGAYKLDCTLHLRHQDNLRLDDLKAELDAVQGQP